MRSAIEPRVIEGGLDSLRVNEMKITHRKYDLCAGGEVGYVYPASIPQVDSASKRRAVIAKVGKCRILAELSMLSI